MGKKRETRIIHKVLDGEASKKETRVLKKKLKEDPMLKSEFEGLKAVNEISQAIPPAEPPKDFREKVLKKLKK